MAQFAGMPLQLRATFGVGAMVSEDQLGWLNYNSLGFTGDIQLGYGALPWLDVRVGMSAGAFPSLDRVGALLNPLLGFAIGWPDENAALRPWLQLDAGVGFTGNLQRPVFRSTLGVDFRVVGSFTLAPVVGYTQVVQYAGEGNSTDARYLWFGFAVGVSGQRRKVTEHESWDVRQRVIRRTQTVIVEREAEDPPELPPATPPAEPSRELIALLDEAVPGQKHEWLAPVLFGFNQAQLEPQGIAMLHEVALALNAHPKLKLLEIRGYADNRGDVAYNQKLSEERATAVYTWLVAHGVAAERLRVAAHGASDFVEPGNDESDHEQNRRVVFRVLDPAEP